MTIGPARLFGILSEREDRVGTSTPTVVFVNAGRIGHQGPAWVGGSGVGVRGRRLAMSADGPQRAWRQSHEARADRRGGVPGRRLDGYGRMRREVTAEFGPQLMLVGLCSGGYHAIEAALLEPVITLCAVNPAISLYPWDPRPERRFEPNVEAASADRNSADPWVSHLVALLAPLRKTARQLPAVGGYSSVLLVTEPGSAFRALDGLWRRSPDSGRAHRWPKAPRGRAASVPLAHPEEFLRIGGDARPGALTAQRTGRDHVSGLIRAFLTGVSSKRPTRTDTVDRGTFSDPDDAVTSSGSTPRPL